MPKAEYTDTQRIDFLAKLGCFEVEHEYLGPVRLDPEDERGEGPTLRAAIDKAMRKEKVKTSAGVPSVEAPSLDLDRVMRLADVHAEASHEDGRRMFDRGGLKAFVDDCVRIAAAGVETINIVDDVRAQYERTLDDAGVDTSVPTNSPAVEKARR